MKGHKIERRTEGGVGVGGMREVACRAEPVMPAPQAREESAVLGDRSGTSDQPHPFNPSSLYPHTPPLCILFLHPLTHSTHYPPYSSAHFTLPPRVHRRFGYY